MRTEIGRLQRRAGTTTLYVTHDQAEAVTLGDRVAVMRDGRVEQVGAPREVYARPATAFVAGFIGTPSTNLVHSRLVDGAVDLGGATIPLPARQRKKSVSAMFPANSASKPPPC